MAKACPHKLSVSPKSYSKQSTNTVDESYVVDNEVEAKRNVYCRAEVAGKG